MKTGSGSEKMQLVYFPGTHESHGLNYLLDEDEGQSILRHAHPIQQHLRPECCCKEDKRAGLVIRRLGDNYYIARMPNNGSSHDRDCCFYGEGSNESGRGEYVKSAIYTAEDGKINVSASFALQKNRIDDQIGEPVRECGTQGTKRQQIGLNGLLSLIWNDAQLNEWRPSYKRNWALVRRLLIRQCSNIRINGREINEVLCIQPGWQDTDGGINGNWLEQAIINGESKPSLYSLVLFQIDNASIRESYKSVKLSTNAGKGDFWVSRQLAEVLAKRFPRIWPSIFKRKTDVRNFALCRGEWIKKDDGESGYFKVADAALLQTNSKLIPVESSYELQMVNALIDSDRTFVKPLRYDAKEETVFPDGILIDTEEQTFLEVYGISGIEEYEKNKERKREEYRKMGAKIWEWTPSKEDMPDFPPKRVN